MLQYVLRFTKLLIIYLSTLIILLLSNQNVLARDITIIVPNDKDEATSVFLKTFIESGELKNSGINIKAYSYEVISKSSQSSQEILKGTVDMGLISSSMIPGLNDDEYLRGTALISSPGMTLNPREKFLYEDTVLGDVVAIELGNKGFVFLSFWDAIPSSLITKGTQVVDSGLAGLKISAGDFRSRQLLAQLGAITNNSFAAAETMNALRAGAIDGSEFVVEPSSQNFILSEIQGTLLSNFNQRSGYLLSNHKFWVNLKEAERRAIQKAALLAQEAARQKVRDIELQLPSIAEKNNYKLVSFSSFSDKSQLRKISIANWSEGFNEDQNQSLDLLEVALKQRDAGFRQEREPETHARTASPVFFLTSRNDEKSSDLRSRFGIFHDDKAELSCGGLDYTATHPRKFGDPYDGPMNLTVNSFVQGADGCVQKILTAAQQAGGKLTIFVHGYNNTFSASIDRAVALAQDLDMTEPLIVWSWPSEGTVSGYIRDIAAVEFNRDFMREVINKLRKLTYKLEITLLAHSMGSRIGLDFLAEFADKNMKFSNVVFVAPDVSQARFERIIRKHGHAGSLVSFYSNAYDKPLRASKVANRLQPAGLAGKDLLVFPEAETIDVSDVAGEWLGSNHSHAFDIPVVAGDAKKLLKNRRSANIRGLPTKQFNRHKFYFIQK